MTVRTARLGQIASGSATQGLWLGNRKLRSQIVGEDRSRPLGRRTVGEVRRRGNEEEPATERKREYTHLGSDIGDREKRGILESTDKA